MLIVIVIISILASLTMVGVTMAIRSSRISNTELLVRNLEGALEIYKTRWGDYAPSTLRAMRISVPNDTNNGIEALTACLAGRAKGEPLLKLPSEELYGNSDDDELRSNPTNWFFGDTKLREIRDYFGGTLAYLHHRDYPSAGRDLLRYVLKPGSKPAEIKACRSGTTATFARPAEFQIFSAGPDGEFGSSDDIRPW